MHPMIIFTARSTLLPQHYAIDVNLETVAMLASALKLHLIDFFFIAAFASVLTYIPITIAGLGVQEAGYVLLLHVLLGLPLSAINPRLVAFALITRVLFTGTDMIGVSPLLKVGLKPKIQEPFQEVKAASSDLSTCSVQLFLYTVTIEYRPEESIRFESKGSLHLHYCRVLVVASHIVVRASSSTLNIWQKTTENFHVHLLVGQL